MTFRPAIQVSLVLAWLGYSPAAQAAESGMRFNAAPFATALPEGNGLVWDDPREIHEVRIRFPEAPSPGTNLRLEYWVTPKGWPKQHLPKDREPGGGDAGWVELGNWYVGAWHPADTDLRVQRNTATFTFRPVTEKEFPGIKDAFKTPDSVSFMSKGKETRESKPYDARFRYTFKLRVASDQPLPRIERIEAFTDSVLEPRTVRLAWAEAPKAGVKVSAFNGAVKSQHQEQPRTTILMIQAVQNSDPNTFDRTLVTVATGQDVFTFNVDDLDAGPLYLPEYKVAVLPQADKRNYAAVAADAQARGGKTLYEQVGALPEQTWNSAWEGIPPKRSRMCFPLGLDGARQKFRLDGNGELSIRMKDLQLLQHPAGDNARLKLERAPVRFGFGLPAEPAERHTEEDCLPICVTTWERDGVRVEQTAFATALGGASGEGPPPAPDVFAVALLKFVFTNTSEDTKSASLPFSIRSGNAYEKLRLDSEGLLWDGDQVRGQISGQMECTTQGNRLTWSTNLPAHSSCSIVCKLPFVVLTAKAEHTALATLDFEREHKEVAGYWRRQIERSARLITPEPILNQFYRALPAHLLINSDFDAGSNRRLARVGSFHYGVYGNESCMMALEYDRRGYEKEAEQCLETWLHYQGTVGLPGDFSTNKTGILYGAGGYEAGEYNQHHGWILWMLAEHYRFTRDRAWLAHAAPGIVAGADWIIRETERTAARTNLSRGLLPAGTLEDIGDWWTWLSTSCYTWRGLDAAAWALAELRHPDAKRIRKAADKYHQNLMANFMAASARSPVVRLRDGTAAPQVPARIERRGRSFGWICQTLEGPMHLIITRAIDPKSPLATWILQDYEDNLYLSNQYGYQIEDFDNNWFGRGGMSMQACLLFGVESYLYRDDVKPALRAMFNAIAVSHFADVHMNAESALPHIGDWFGDHYKTSDESNACGWLRFIFVREQGDALLLGQAVPRQWLKPGMKCGIENTLTYFGPVSLVYNGGANEITALVQGPVRNAPKTIRLRFREPDGRLPREVTVNGKSWKRREGEWVILPGDVGKLNVRAMY